MWVTCRNTWNKFLTVVLNGHKAWCLVNNWWEEYSVTKTRSSKRLQKKTIHWGLWRYIFRALQLTLPFTTPTIAARLTSLHSHCCSYMFILFNTRWFKYDRDKVWLVYTKSVPVIFEPPCIYVLQCDIIKDTHSVEPCSCISSEEIFLGIILFVKDPCMFRTYHFDVIYFVHFELLYYSQYQQLHFILHVGPVWEYSDAIVGTVNNKL